MTGIAPPPPETTGGGVASPWLVHRPTLRAETLALAVSLWFTAACNTPFWNTLLAPGEPATAASPALIAACVLMLTEAHMIVLVVFLNRWTTRPLLTLLVIGTAFAAYYMQRYFVYLDPSMLRNILRTDAREATELLSWSMLPPVAALSAPPLALVWLAKIRHTTPMRAAGFRALTIALALATMVTASLACFQEFSALMRQKKELRFLATPGNALYSLPRVLVSDARSASGKREPIGSDAVLARSWQDRKRPVLMLIVVGETVRSANWGLSGYPRQTTPELAATDAINFPNVTACGTNTEVSVPCMFSSLGRRNYDEARIRGSESLLHLLRRAGFRVAWLDNQSGCKGVCDGIETWQPGASTTPALCASGGCLDEALLTGVKQIVDGTHDNLVLVMHPLGNHGPAYFKRYPVELRQYTPTCDSADLGRCTREEVVNAYDNAVRYTDHVLARAIDFLRTQTTHDAAMIYVSDHGESLGEKGLFLHGVPYAIAPKEQTQVPMAMWLSPGYADSFALAPDCLRQRASLPATHDNLFHTVLGMLDVHTATRDRRLDLSDACKPSPTPG